MRLGATIFHCRSPCGGSGRLRTGVIRPPKLVRQSRLAGPQEPASAAGRPARPEAGGRTRLEYRYEADIGGKVAAVGQRMLGSVMRYLIAQFFHSLERRIRPALRPGWRTWWSRLRGGRSGG